MEDFSLVRVDESPKASGLMAEWQESLSPAKLNSKTELVALALTQEKREGPGKDVADRLDKELKEFADAKNPQSSKDMQSFQKMIEKFCSNPDKKKGMEELGESYSRLHVQMEKDAIATYEEMEAEGAKQPGRKELKADFDDKLGKFFDKVFASPDTGKVLDILEWKEGENKSSHQARVREALKDNKPLLTSYNEMEDASDKVDANKSAKENELEALHRQQIKDYHAMTPVANKAYIRSTIEF